MPELDAWVMVRETLCLADDLSRVLPDAQAQLRDAWPTSMWSTIERVVLTGSGDSSFAAHAVEHAIQGLGGRRCRTVGPLPLVTHDAAALASSEPSQTLLVGISASGDTAGVERAVVDARARGVRTLALTGARSGRVIDAAERSLVVEVPAREPSPGVRTWQASVLGLLSLAFAVAGARAGAEQVATWHGELLAMGPAIDACVRTLGTHLDAVVPELASGPPIAVLGTGPSRGVAMFGVAKLIEAAGRSAFAQDLEEWRHVERLLHPASSWLVAITPPGPAHARATEIVRYAHQQGRRVIAVVGDGDHGLASFAELVVPLPGIGTEAFSPLLTHLPLTLLAPRIARHLGRRAFQAPDVT